MKKAQEPGRLDQLFGGARPSSGPIAWAVRMADGSVCVTDWPSQAESWRHDKHNVVDLYEGPSQSGWERHYDRPEHLALDLRQIADNADTSAGYATMDAQIIRRAAACLDRLAEDMSSNEARSHLARSLNAA